MSPRVRELTAPARGAVSVLRVGGPGAADAVRRLLRRPLPAAGELAVARLHEGNELLDEALVVHLGPEELELHVHGSPLLVARLRRILSGGDDGDPPATPRGLAELAREALPDAPGEAAARVLLDQASGALERAVAGLDPGSAEGRARAAGLAALGRLLRPLFEPPVVVLAGPINAGKSTLFNLLVGHERVVVSETGGTTRDAVRERVRMGPWVVELVDTAGERDASPGEPPRGADAELGELERLGIGLGRDERRRAGLVLWLAPAPEPRQPAPGLLGDVRWTPVVSCADRFVGEPEVPGLAAAPRISVLADPAAARRAVERAIVRALELPDDPWVPGRAVPFRREEIETLEELSRATPGRARDVRAALLAGRPAAPRARHPR